MPHTVKIQSPAFQTTLPKGAGVLDVNSATFPDVIVEELIVFAVRQKLANVAVQMHVKADRKEVKDGDLLYDSTDDLKKAIRERGLKLLTRFAEGEWNLEGAGRSSDPVEAEEWSQYFTRLEITAKERPDARRRGIPALAVELAVKMGRKKADGPRIMVAVRAAAASVIAARTIDLQIELPE